VQRRRRVRVADDERARGDLPARKTLRVEGQSFKATNVGVEFKGVRSGVERRRGVSSGLKP
jgi:hypothetical protein